MDNGLDFLSRIKVRRLLKSRTLTIEIVPASWSVQYRFLQYQSKANPRQFGTLCPTTVSCFTVSIFRRSIEFLRKSAHVMKNFGAKTRKVWSPPRAEQGSLLPFEGAVDEVYVLLFRVIVERDRVDETGDWRKNVFDGAVIRDRNTLDHCRMSFRVEQKWLQPLVQGCEIDAKANT